MGVKDQVSRLLSNFSLSIVKLLLPVRDISIELFNKTVFIKRLIFLSLFSIVSCNNGAVVLRISSSQKDFDYSKKYAKVIDHYKDPKDSLKLKALYFILKNLDHQFYLSGAWINSFNTAVKYDKNISVNDLLTKSDSISQLIPVKLDTLRDDGIITSDYLIKNIDRAFETRKNKWVQDVNFNDFCEYVLPYKIDNEKPETWGMCLETEPYLKSDSLKKIESIFQATAYVNDRLNWYKGTLDYDYPVEIGYEIARHVATGTCNSMTRMVCFQTRALGLPVVVDYALTWGNRSEGHSWNSLIYKNHTYPFDANGPNIGFYKIEFKGTGRMPYKIAKVFRKTFSKQVISLAAIDSSSYPIPDIFYSTRIKDVTEQYVPVSDITLNYWRNFDDKFAYLSTFNNESWVICQWGMIDGRKITFKKMGRDMVYLPVLYSSYRENNKLTPIGNPFILYKNGKIKELKADEDEKQTLIIERKYPDDESNKIFRGDKYELFYWRGSWKSLGSQVAKEDRLYFNNVPKGGLYWVRDLSEGKQERIFTYENGNQIWW